MCMCVCVCVCVCVYTYNTIDLETSVNVRKCLYQVMLFIETNLKSKRYTIQQYKRLFLLSSNVQIKLDRFFNTSSPDDGQRLGKKY